MEGYRNRLEQAQAGPDPRQNIVQIKRAVIDEVRETDPRVKVATTEYFNHTFAPDLVLTWPADCISRYLYIRTDSDPARLQEDVSCLKDKHPVLFNLAQVADKDDLRQRELVHATTESDVLITDASGLAAVIDDRRVHPVVQLASAALLQGGRGVVDEDQGRSIARAFNTGFEAAREVEPQGTAVAAEAIDEFFDSPSSKRLGQFLQAVWIGSGGAPSSFPGRSNMSSDLSGEAFRFLLELDEFDDIDFWRRVGRNLTVDRIASMDVNADSPNFQHLIQGNLDVLRARICRILSTDGMLIDSSDTFRWTREAGLLALRGARFTAVVAERAEDMHLEAQQRRGIGGEELIRRADQVRRRVERVDLSGPAYSLLYESEGADATHEKPLREILSTLGRSVHVRAASVLLAEGRSLRCDFETRTASGRGPATFPLADLVESALRVMEDLTPAEVSELDELFASWRVPPGQETLF